MGLFKRENVTHNVFFRSRINPNEYYAADPKVSNTYGHNVVTWVLKQIGKEDKIVVNTSVLAKDYEPCSPYEALGSTLI